MIITVEENIELHLTSEKFAKELFQAIDNNRIHLSKFLPWVGNMQAEENVRQYLIRCETLQQEKKEISFIILYEKAVVGRIGIHHLSYENKTGAIGYWLSKDAAGKGIITKSCVKLLDYGFEEMQLNRIEIKAAVKNFKSQAIPEKLKFTKEGILRQAEIVNGEYLDLFIYAMLKDEWGK
jgi:ribosomal-protein-serine acetyltransferase